MNARRAIHFADFVRHHEKMLRKIFKVPKFKSKGNPFQDGDLYMRLQKLERKAAAIALQLCNGPEFEGGYEQVDTLCEKILDEVDRLLGFRKLKIKVFINRDPRGHALKIGDDDVRTGRMVIPTDWGGYGILAPEYRL